MTGASLASTIVGYVGARPAADVLIERLGSGGDEPSAVAGIAVLAGRETHVRQATGAVGALRRLVTSTPAPGRVGLGHRRPSATVMTPRCSVPAHHGGVSVALHGRLPGAVSLRARASRFAGLGPVGGHVTISGSDADVLAHLIAHHRQAGESLLAATHLTLPILDGAATFLAMCEDEPDTLVFSCGPEPLTLGVGADGVVLGNDRRVVDDDLQVRVALDIGDTGVAALGLEVHVFDIAGQLVRRPRR